MHSCLYKAYIMLPVYIQNNVCNTLTNVDNSYFWDLGSLMAFLKGNYLLFAIVSLTCRNRNENCNKLKEIEMYSLPTYCQKMN